jgi:hypothetical protein
MSTRPRRCIAASVALSSLFSVQACHAYQRPAPANGISYDSRVRVRSAQPFIVLPAAASASGTERRECRATIVEGHVSRVSADSVTFQGLRAVVPANGDAASCQWARSSTVIVPIGGTDVTVNRFSGKRTVVLLLVIAASLVALAALAASQIEYGLGDGGDCAFC